MVHGYLVVSKINKTTGCDVLALHIKARRFMRRALGSCFMHALSQNRCALLGDMHWSPAQQCIPTLEPAPIGVFIRHSSNFHSETQ
ncbi:hypothetical protein [Mesorhizobium metallidurans]|nr:hypothetical protein [Mesorhizobium metallidurans]